MTIEQVPETGGPLPGRARARGALAEDPENQTTRRSRAFARPGYDFTWMWGALKINDLGR